MIKIVTESSKEIISECTRRAHSARLIFSGSPASVMVVRCESGLIESSVGVQWPTDAHTDGSSEHNTAEQNNVARIIQQEQLHRPDNQMPPRSELTKNCYILKRSSERVSLQRNESSANPALPLHHYFRILQARYIFFWYPFVAKGRKSNKSPYLIGTSVRSQRAACRSR